ncbi:hypothetical protein [Streptomyces sp. NPDC002690]
MQKAAAFSAVAAASLGTGVLSAPAAQAAPPICPLVVAVCTWTEPGFEGNLRLLFDGEGLLMPPVRSAVNQDVQAWCFYERPYFDNRGEMREVSVGEQVNDFGFEARSATQGQCQYDS